MFKKFAFTLIALLLGAGYAQGQTASDTYKNIQINYTQSTTTPCTSTVQKSCLLGYEATYTAPQNGGDTVVPTCNPYASPAVTTGCIGLVSTYTWSPGGFLYTGNWSISLKAVGLDANGVIAKSSAALTSVVVPVPFLLSPATGITAALKP